jgi:hypothetical protein
MIWNHEIAKADVLRRPLCIFIPAARLAIPDAIMTNVEGSGTGGGGGDDGPSIPR